MILFWAIAPGTGGRSCHPSWPRRRIRRGCLSDTFGRRPRDPWGAVEGRMAGRSQVRKPEVAALAANRGADGCALVFQASSGANVTAVPGSASGARGSVSLFGGPPIVFNPQPTGHAASMGGNVTDSQPSIVFQAGPLQVFTSGPANVSSRGALGPAASVTSTATVLTLAVGGTTAASISATCTATETGLTARRQ